MSWLPAWSSCRWCDIHCVSIRLGALLSSEKEKHRKCTVRISENWL